MNIIRLIALISLGTTATAYAHPSWAGSEQGWFSRKPSCNVPREDWIPEPALRQKLEGQGFQVERVKLNKRQCLEAKVRDRNGYRVELDLDPKDGRELRRH